MTETPTLTGTQGRAAAGKYLTFLIGRESYGLSVLKVREIIRSTEITAVPQMPAYVRGVINLRGKIVPVLDLRVKFGLDPSAANSGSCIVVVQVQGRQHEPVFAGLIVDGVEEVVNITAAEMEPTPDFGAQLDTRCLLGMAKLKQGVTTLLDIDHVTAAESLVGLTTKAAA